MLLLVVTACLSVAAALGPLEAATVSEKDSSDFLANNRRRLTYKTGYHGGNKGGASRSCAGEEAREGWDSEERNECFQKAGMKCDYGYWKNGPFCSTCPCKSQLYNIFPSCYFKIPTFYMTAGHYNSELNTKDSCSSCPAGESMGFLLLWLSSYAHITLL